MRRIKPSEIVEGQTVFIFGDDKEYHEMFIQTVLRPNDRFKAFTASDGCRYGLDSTYIDEDSNEKPIEIELIQPHCSMRKIKCDDAFLNQNIQMLIIRIDDVFEYFAISQIANMKVVKGELR